MTPPGENSPNRPVVTQPDIEAGLQRLGLEGGDVCMVHSSLSSFGWVVGGAETVIAALLSVVGPDGTVVLPTFCRGEDSFEIWDIEKSPSYVGRITEVFRLRPDSLRSDHPTHSVAAIGPLAEEITAGHTSACSCPGPWGPAAFGQGSPWQRLYEHNALYIFLGVDFSVNTIGHYVQHQLLEGILALLPPPQQAQATARLRTWLKPGVWPDYSFGTMERPLAEGGLVTYTQTGAATCRSIRSRAAVDIILKILRTEPDKWLDPNFLAWRRQVYSAVGSSAGASRPRE